MDLAAGLVSEILHWQTNTQHVTTRMRNDLDFFNIQTVDTLPSYLENMAVMNARKLKTRNIRLCQSFRELRSHCDSENLPA
jgi:hypothetical protein